VAAALEAAERLRENASAAWAHNAAVHAAACRSDPAAVLAAAEWALTDPQHDSLPQPPFFGWPVQHAAALVRADRLEEAAQRLDLLEAQAVQRGCTARLAGLSRVRGELAARRRDTATARAAFEHAEQLGAGVADALEAALLQAAYGRFLRRRGERRAAAERLTRARDLLRALGAQPLLDECERELAGCALQRSASPGVDRLTPQEAAVARLVGEGRTNAQAAATLGLSAKTISYHLAHVFEKLQVRSRTELALRLRAEPNPGEHPGRRTVTVPTV
jgi:DNA-binding CsgD family transcriptional regulator